MIRSLILILSVLPLNSAWAINKCATSSGGYVFQDLPCTGKGEAIKVMPGSGAADASTEESVAKSKKMVADVNSRSKVQEAIASHYPLIGMTRSELDQAMGAPTTVNASILITQVYSKTKLFIVNRGKLGMCTQNKVW
jgi:hypothetical protein